MTKFTVIALTLCFCALTFAGCCTASRPGSCGCIEGNVCGWNFYKPADLVEGQAGCGTRDLCAPPCCEPGIPYSQATVAPAAPVEAAPAPAADEAEAVVEETVAEFSDPAPAR